MMIRNRILLTASALLFGLAAFAQTHRMDIDLKKVGAPVQPTMYGIFFEDINFAADGGLYAELVKNRSFEFPQDPLQGWKAFGKVTSRAAWVSGSSKRLSCWGSAASSASGRTWLATT